MWKIMTMVSLGNDYNSIYVKQNIWIQNFVRNPEYIHIKICIYAYIQKIQSWSIVKDIRT